MELQAGACLGISTEVVSLDVKANVSLLFSGLSVLSLAIFSLSFDVSSIISDMVLSLFSDVSFIPSEATFCFLFVVVSLVPNTISL